MMSYAEDEADVEGTVNGVTNTASGERCHLVLLLEELVWECRLLLEGSWGGR